VVPEAHWDGVLVGSLELVDFWLGAGRVGEEEGLLLEIHVGPSLPQLGTALGIVVGPGVTDTC
jgi:hypothetical protein